MRFARAPPRVSRYYVYARGKGRTSWHPVLPLLLPNNKERVQVFHYAVVGGKTHIRHSIDTSLLYAPLYGSILEPAQVLL